MEVAYLDSLSRYLSTLMLPTASVRRPQKERPMKPSGRTEYLERRRFRAVQLMEEGIPRNLLARVLDCSAASLSRWRKLADSGMLAAKPHVGPLEEQKSGKTKGKYRLHVACGQPGAHRARTVFTGKKNAGAGGRKTLAISGTGTPNGVTNVVVATSRDHTPKRAQRHQGKYGHLDPRLKNSVDRYPACVTFLVVVLRQGRMRHSKGG